MFVNCSGRELSVFSLIDLADKSMTAELLLYGLEHVFVQVLNIVAGYFIYLSIRIKIWHANLTIITIFFVSTVYWCTTGRIIVLVLNFTGMGEDDCHWLYRMGTFFQIMYCCTTVHALPAVVYERWMAYLHLEDYETTTRRHIPPTVIVISLAIGFLLTDALDLRFSTAQVLIYAMVLNGFFFLIFLWLWKRNLDHLGAIDEVSYSLSKRFQLIENIKVFKLLRNTAIVLMSIVLIVAGFKEAVPSLYFNGVRYDSYLVTPMIWAQTIIIAVAVWSVDVWRNFTTDHLPCAGKMSRQLVAVVPVSLATDLYFDQLSKSWMLPPSGKGKHT